MAYAELKTFEEHKKCYPEADERTWNTAILAAGEVSNQHPGDKMRGENFVAHAIKEKIFGLLTWVNKKP